MIVIIKKFPILHLLSEDRHVNGRLQGNLFTMGIPMGLQYSITAIGTVVLQVAVGHIEWSSLPIGGESTHSILSGHRGLPSAKLFSDLDKLREGDVFILQILDQTFTYEVDQILIVLPDVIDGLLIEEGKDLCTLVTCTPYGVNTHRLLVRDSRIPYEEAEQITAEITVEEAAGSTWEEKYVNGILTGFTIVCLIALLGGVIWFSRRR